MKTKKIRSVIVVVMAILLTASLAGCGMVPTTLQITLLPDETANGSAAILVEADAEDADTEDADIEAADTEVAYTQDMSLEEAIAEEKDTDTLIAPFADGTESFEIEEIPYYYVADDGSDDVTEDTIEVGYLDGERGIPYLNVKEYVNMAKIGNTDSRFNVSYEAYDTYCALIRENGAAVVLDFEANEIFYIGNALFYSPPGSESGMDNVSIGKNENINTNLLVAVNVSEVEGDTRGVSLEDYCIPMVQYEDEFYIPLQTFSDVLLATNYVNLYYNQKAVFLVRFGELQNADGSEKTKLGEIYYDAEPLTKSEALTQFTYNELCMSFDYYYGLAQEHNIDSFDEYFIRTGLSEYLYSDSPMNTFVGLKKLSYGLFADGHSGPRVISPMADVEDALDLNEKEIQSMLLGDISSVSNASELYEEARNEYYPDGIIGYEEVDNTAYVTFDHFYSATSTDYYNTEPENTTDDVISLILYANSQIHREDSPIENVVLDISCNGGGQIDVAACVIAWFLEGGKICLKDQIDGSRGITAYYLDGNLNGVIDSGDNVSDKNLYCIISPASFSCGNLVPASFKASSKVTLLGRQTGGGGCIVQPLTTADGTGLQISGRQMVSYTANGSFYGADEGVTPDFTISDPEHIYDREYMTDYINNLP